nr:PD40 domain-containing protein [Pseudonocardiales bacterium]
MSHRLWSLATATTLILPLGCDRAAGGAPGAPGGDADSPRPREYGIDEFLSTVSMRGLSFSPDGRKILVSSNRSGVYNAYAVPVDGGAPVPLTRSTSDNISADGYFPRDERFLYVSDRGGNELAHVYVRELDGSTRDLTPGAKVKARLLGWAGDDATFFLTTNERDPQAFDVYEITADGYRRSLLYRNRGGYEIADVSPDRRFVALNRRITMANSDAYLHDRRTGRTRHLTPHTGQVANWAEAFSPDGRSLYLVSDQGSEFQHLVRYDLATGKLAVIERPEWDVESAGFTRDRRYLVVSVNADARTVTRLYQAATMRPVPLPRLPSASITDVEVSPDGRHLAYYLYGDRSPGDLWVRDLVTGTDRLLVRNLSPKVDPAHLVEGRGVRFKSYDGVEIPGILYRPRQTTGGSKAPALVWVHGGPGDQSRFGYNPFIQYLVNHGYAVYA